MTGIGWRGRVELLRQNLFVESDLQGFAGFVLESVASFNGGVFSATRGLLGLMETLRAAGAAAGYPLPVTLVLSGQHLLVEWGNQSLPLVRLPQVPPQADVEQLHQHLQRATVMTDPDLLLQRNAEMMRHFEEVRTRNEKELAELQQALENGRVELRELLHQAETDPLTGLYNRRAFDARLVQMFRHIMRQRNSPLSLLLLDLDHFKQINDRFGHQFGDTYLNKMADVLRGIIREDVDCAFRFGGDEFAVMIYADYSLACEKAQQALQMMEGRVSIGIATINAATPDGLAVDEFFRRADGALYQAKNRGRGRIVVELCGAHDNSCCTSSCSSQLLQDEYRV